MKSTRETRRLREEDAGGHMQFKKNTRVVNPSKAPRTAFGDLTNAVQKNEAHGKKEIGKKAKLSTVEVKECKPKPCVPKTKISGVVPPPATRKTRKASSQPTNVAAHASKAKTGPGKKTCKAKLEDDVALTEDYDYTDGIAGCASPNLSDIIMAELEISPGRSHSRMSLDKVESPESKKTVPALPEGVEDVDGNDYEDLTLVALYTVDIFNYYKEREAQFKLEPYMDQQPNVSQRMRAVLVDWLVEVQENFELNHETLYLAVKLVDTYLTIVPNLRREDIQLLGSAALFLAAKFDERLAPAIEDFIYICDNAYDRRQFMAMERDLFRTVGFDLGRPISYRFLRRYARCGRADVKTLYLARYLLELSLMEYKFVFHRDSMIAASCLYIAKQMRDEGGWTPTLEFYTGYKLSELKPLIIDLNTMFTSSRQSELSTIRDKYRHYLFHCVGQIPPLSNEQLLAQIDQHDQH